jgi:hypothetical protein
MRPAKVTNLEKIWLAICGAGLAFVSFVRLPRVIGDWLTARTADDIIQRAARGRLRRGLERWTVLLLLTLCGVASIVSRRHPHVTEGWRRGSITALVLAAIGLVVGSVLDERTDRGMVEAAQRGARRYPVEER